MIYLDNAASSWPKPEPVIERTVEWIRTNGANPGRSNHRASLEARRAVKRCREGAADLLGVNDSSRVVLTSSATQAINMALWGILREGDHVVTSVLDHNSVLRPLHELGRRRDVRFTVVRPEPDGRIDPASVEEALTDRTRLVALTHASNLIGTVQPVQRIVRRVRARGGNDTRVLVDAAQSAGVLPLPVSEWDLDLLAFSGHKSLFGLQGTGGLYVRSGCSFPPLVSGGTGSESHRPVMPRSMPDRHEPGTANTPGLVSLGSGIRFVRETGLETIREHERELVRRIVRAFSEIPEVQLYNPMPGESSAPATSAVLFNLAGVDPVQAAYFYDRHFDIALRAGLHCAPWAHRWLGTLGREPTGAIRASPGFFTTEDEVAQLIDATRDLCRRFADSKDRAPVPGGESPK